jgi:superfamily II DNA or RNA helicase
MLQIFNGAYSLLPESIQSQLVDSEIDTNTDVPFRNLRGDILKLLMITQSGAEGISLRNVRRVFITEPFWNMVRMDQVIGRAVRMGSHDELPSAERNVEVFIYTSVLTEEQLNENFTLRRQDNSVTSDTHILQKAVKKDELIQVFLNNLKSIAIDCRNNSSENLMTKNGLSCYAFPIPSDPNEYTYTSSFEDDKTKLEQSKLIRHRKIQGRVVSTTENGMKKKYVILDSNPGKMYDYNAYKNAGVLVEV